MDNFNHLPISERPFDTVWGNGESLTEEELYDFAALYAKYTLYVAYEPGDMFLLDNIKFKHGRTPYIG